MNSKKKALLIGNNPKNISIMESNLNLLGYSCEHIPNNYFSTIFLKIRHLITHYESCVIYYCGDYSENVLINNIINHKNFSKQLIIIAECYSSKKVKLKRIVKCDSQIIILLISIANNHFTNSSDGILTKNFWKYFNGACVDISLLRKCLKFYGQDFLTVFNNNDVSGKYLSI